MAGRKIFVGSLPSEITDSQLRSEFARFGTVEEVFIKDNCEPSRQWAFITFSTTAQAQQAKEACDRTLQFPGADRPCDVMLAKNQGMFGQAGEPGHNSGGGGYGGPPSSAVPKKIFVGSLPDGMQAEPIRAEFSKYGSVEDVFVKPGCESGRQWAFVTFTTSDQAASAAELTNGVLMFPGSLRPCEVTLARNQGMFGQGSLPQPGSSGPPGPKKCFVGTLPDSITADMLRSEFSKWGQVTDIYLKENCDAGRKWGFITFGSPDQALAAKQGADRVLMFPGADKPCEVTIAKHQGMFGQDSIEDQGYSGGSSYGSYGPASAPCKVFVGSLPDGCEENLLRAELSKYGHITDVFLKPNCEPGRQWAFVTFAQSDQAQRAKDACDRQLVLPNNGDRVCEVMLAKNQGKFGEAPLEQFKGGGKGDWSGGGGGYGGKGGGKGYNQPPPPSSPPPPHLTPWRMYKTASGLPYYHNENTGETVWDPPPDFQAAGNKGGGSWGKGDGGWGKGDGGWGKGDGGWGKGDGGWGKGDGGWGKGGGDGGWGKGCGDGSWGKGDGGWGKGGGDGGWGKGGGDGGWGKGCGDGSWGSSGGGKGGCGAYGGGGCGGGGCGDGGMKGGSRYGPY